MRKIKISNQIIEASPEILIGAIRCNITYETHKIRLWQKILEKQQEISLLDTESIKLIPQIESTRQIYKNLGKEPSRYRPSAEALMRRIVLGKEMYKISNIVDVINLASITTGYSIGGYDDDSLFGEITFARGEKETVYDAIGRGILNIDGLPVFFDEIGAFGSPTSDSVRTMITSKTKSILLMVMNFANHDGFDDDLKHITQLLVEHCNAQNIEIEKIK